MNDLSKTRRFEIVSILDANQPKSSPVQIQTSSNHPYVALNKTSMNDLTKTSRKFEIVSILDANQTKSRPGQIKTSILRRLLAFYIEKSYIRRLSDTAVWMSSRQLFSYLLDILTEESYRQISKDILQASWPRPLKHHSNKTSTSPEIVSILDVLQPKNRPNFGRIIRCLDVNQTTGAWGVDFVAEIPSQFHACRRRVLIRHCQRKNRMHHLTNYYQ